LIVDTNALSAFVDGEADVGEILQQQPRALCVPTNGSETDRTADSANDAWIAALAIQHGLPILSRDEHFDGLPGVQRIGWSLAEKGSRWTCCSGGPVLENSGVYG